MEVTFGVLLKQADAVAAVKNAKIKIPQSIMRVAKVIKGKWPELGAG